uniref:Uncharacterized protein n=1 Tax=Glossina pallidipes TaxID=7398 RepID=A0A1A9ZW67_GLOPL
MFGRHRIHFSPNKDCPSFSMAWESIATVERNLNDLASPLLKEEMRLSERNCSRQQQNNYGGGRGRGESCVAYFAGFNPIAGAMNLVQILDTNLLHRKMMTSKMNHSRLMLITKELCIAELLETRTCGVEVPFHKATNSTLNDKISKSDPTCQD